jgi:thiamine-phosphate pyrophosphorylase
MKLIVITSSELIEDEHYLLGEMLDMGLPSLHVRKPQLSSAELKNYLGKFSRNQQKKIIIHTHYNILWNIDLKGIHVSKQHRKKQFSFFFSKATLRLRRGNFLLATSSRSLDSLDDAYKDFDYVMVSPIFTNPNGHQPSFNPTTLKRVLPNYPDKVIARGGATLESIDKAKEIGFSGIAFHQYIWNNPEPLEAFQKIVDRFHELGLSIE